MRICEVIVESKTRMTDQRYTYSIPKQFDHVVPGARVIVPFGRGNRKTIAMAMSVEEVDEKTVANFAFAPKDILEVADEEPILTEELLAIAKHMVDHDLSDKSSAIQTVLPPGKLGEVKPRYWTYYSLTDNPSEIESLRGAKQKAIVEVLASEGPLEQNALLRAADASLPSLRSLEAKGILKVEKERRHRNVLEPVQSYAKITLNSAQQEVFDQIGAEGNYLICGVTGSGKTEIYLQLVERALQEGKDAIVLVPEISLTPQTIQRFQGRFGDQIAVLHSRLTTAERFEQWERIRYGEARIAIGARSAVFAPFENLGILVVDEEHESSYYSEKNPKYSAIDIAAFRAKWNGCPLVLGSATPSIESLYEAQKGNIVRLDLKNRVAGKALPKVEIVDMREELKQNNRSMFSSKLRSLMEDAISRGEQCILFLNKRGHTSFVFCRSCGYVYRCDACDVAMTYHKHQDRLICHYCGRTKAYRHTCEQCGSDAVKEFGAGTEMLEEETKRIFPNARIRRADADTMSGKHNYRDVYDQMRNGQIDILLGTQMIAKGFDFPNVTVVGIMAADITLNLPDIRAQERTFQLLTQVAGRAGRGDSPGHVIVQTYKPDHPAILASVDHDVDAFYDWEIQRREMMGYPPIKTELHIGFSSLDRSKCIRHAEHIHAMIAMGTEAFPEETIQISGPTAAVIERIDRRYRYGIVVRSQNEAALIALGKKILEEKPNPAVYVNVTIRPRSIY